MHSLPHSWSNQVNARNDGKYDQWLNVKQNSAPEYSHMPLTMGYHIREDLPFYYSMADAFTVCDQNFCSSLTGTNPNRLYFWTGTIREDQHENSRAHVWNDDMDYGTLKWTTFPERLEALGISWKCYQNEMSIDTGLRGEEDPWLSNFQDNPLEFFAQYHIRLHERHMQFLKDSAAAATTQAAANATQAAAGSAQSATTPSFDELSSLHQSLHRRAFDTNTGDPHYHHLEDLTYTDNGTKHTMKAPKGDVLHQFRQDVQSGKLPTVSWLSAPENFSDHPSAPWYGAWYVSEVLDILTKNPEVWKKTIFILAYDENDGYFDHVAPFTAPHPHLPGTGKVSAGIDTSVDFVTFEQAKERKDFPEKFMRESSIGLGFRVPLIVASPWTRGGWVNSQVFDHTSTLQFLEKFLSHKTGRTVVEPNISDWRRLVCGDLTSVFRPYNGETLPKPEFLPKDAFLEGIHKAQYKKLPDSFKALSPDEIALFNKHPHLSPHGTRQEPGTRPSCALPYQLQTEGRLSADKKRFELAFTNSRQRFGDRTAGAPFNVYAPGFEPVRTWAYGVKPGDTLTDNWPLHEFQDQLYHLCVYGPNGFFREFRGNGSDPLIDIQFADEGSANPNGLLHLKNQQSHSCVIEIVDHAYGASYPPKTLTAGSTTTLTLPFGNSHGWYDLSVTVHGFKNFEKRYAGRIETGSHSMSDPFMGRAMKV
jgi:phospholipase C